MPLRPYTGFRQQEHLANEGQLGLSRYGDDTSGTKVYCFNSAGFRGEEYDEQAKKVVAVCGCSHTFGVGLNVEEVWPYQFKLRYAAEHGLGVNQVNLLNFSHGGCSNDYITRSFLNQASGIRTDLAIVQFTYSDRVEGISGCELFDVAPWLLENALENGNQWGDEIQGYYQYHSDETGVLNTLKNMLLLQFYFCSSKIPYLFTWIQHSRLEDTRFRDHRVLSPLVKQLDRNRICPFSLLDFAIDYAADGVHLGSKTHEAFAKRTFDFYRFLAS